MNLQTTAAAGINDHPHFATGWHARESDSRTGIQYRAAMESATLSLLRIPSAMRFCMLLSGPRGLAPETLRGSVTINGAQWPLQLDADVWVVREFPLPAGAGDSLEIAIALPNAPCPDQVLKNGDARHLGWFVSAVWQE